MQLDIFEDSRDVMLRNDLIAALQAQDARAGERVLRHLADEFPEDPALKDGGVLVAALLEIQTQPAPELFSNIEEAAGAAAALGDSLVPCAERLLPRGSAASWLAAHWAHLARRAARLPFVAEVPQGHAAALWLRARDWAAAAECVAGIESWRRIPQPLAWMAEARHQLEGLDAAWPLWVELTWLAPRRFAEAVARVADAPMAKLTRLFERYFEPAHDAGEWAWFPAWCLVESPTLAVVMEGATPAAPSEPAHAWSVLQSLLRLEREGRHHEIVKARAALRECHAELFGLYMKTR